MTNQGASLRNLRLLFIVIGIILVACSLAALAYAFWPVETLQDQSPLVPTLFAPP